MGLPWGQALFGDAFLVRPHRQSRESMHAVLMQRYGGAFPENLGTLQTLKAHGLSLCILSVTVIA